MYLLSRDIHKKDYIVSIFCAILLICVYVFLAPRIWPTIGQDWNGTYMPATRIMLAGGNPYTAKIQSFFSPIWVLIPLIPFSFLPDAISLKLILVLSFLAYLTLGYKLKATPWTMTLFLLSPPVIFSIRQSNIEPFVLLGFILPAPIGLFFALAKPQIGIGIAIYWLIEAWRTGGIQRIIKTIAPVSIALLVNFLIYGNWIKVRQGAVVIAASWNYSLWPWAIPVGLLLLYMAVISYKKYTAVSAGVFLSPYVPLYSWSAALVGLLNNDILMAVAVIVMWMVFFVKMWGI